METTNTTANTASTNTAKGSRKGAKGDKGKQQTPAPVAAQTPEPTQTSAVETQPSEATPAAGHNSNKGKQIQMNTVGPKRELAYAVVGLQAILASVVNALEPVEAAEGEEPVEETVESLRGRILAALDSPNAAEAKAALVKHGYGDLKPRAERVAALQGQLAIAAASGDSAKVIELAKQMKAIQDGRAD